MQFFSEHQKYWLKENRSYKDQMVFWFLFRFLGHIHDENQNFRLLKPYLTDAKAVFLRSSHVASDIDLTIMRYHNSNGNRLRAFKNPFSNSKFS